MLKEKVYSIKITDLDHLGRGISGHFVEIEGNADLIHQVHQNFAKRIQICIDIDGQHVENII